MFDAKVLAQRILLSRRDLGWDQQQLADASGVSRTYISQIERERKTNVGLDVAFALADALGVRVAWLTGEAADPLGENPQHVLKEVGGEYLTIDVESREERRLLQEAVDALREMSPREQRRAVQVVRALREAEQEEQQRDAQVERDLQQLRSKLDLVESIGGGAALDALLEILVVAESDPAAALARMDAFFAVSGQPVGRRRGGRAVMARREAAEKQGDQG